MTSPPLRVTLWRATGQFLAGVFTLCVLAPIALWQNYRAERYERIRKAAYHEAMAHLEAGKSPESLQLWALARGLPAMTEGFEQALTDFFATHPDMSGPMHLRPVRSRPQTSE